MGLHFGGMAGVLSSMYLVAGAWESDMRLGWSIGEWNGA